MIPYAGFFKKYFRSCCNRVSAPIVGRIFHLKKIRFVNKGNAYPCTPKTTSQRRPNRSCANNTNLYKIPIS